MVSPFGGAFRRAASIRSLRPSSSPALCGPRMPLPPENVTRSKPILVYFQRFSTGGTSAAASLNVGTPCFLPSCTNSSSWICPSLLLSLKKSIIAVFGVDRPFELLARLDLDHAHAAVAHGVVVAEAVRLLDDDLALHVGEVGKLDDLLRGRCPVSTAAVPSVRAEAAPRRDHRRFAACTSVAIRSPTAIVQLVEHHVVLGRVVDRLHDLGRHQRRRQRRVGACRVDERPHAQIPEVVGRAHDCCRFGGHRACPDERRDIANHRHRRNGLEKTSAAPHRTPPRVMIVISQRPANTRSPNFCTRESSCRRAPTPTASASHRRGPCDRSCRANVCPASAARSAAVSRAHTG